jgi:hypothetical protein
MIMTAERNPIPDEPAILRLLDRDEQVHHTTTVGGALLAVTSHRIAIIDGKRTVLDLPIEGVRRIEFDVEKTRPATLVIVPEDARYAAEVVSVRPEEYKAVADALATIGLGFAEGDDGE